MRGDPLQQFPGLNQLNNNPAIEKKMLAIGLP